MEASLTLPVLILAVIALILIIRMIAACETIGYISSCELKRSLLVENKIINTVSLCTSIETAMKEECPEVSSFRIRSVRSGIESGGIDDLVTLHTVTDFSVNFAAGINGGLSFDEKLMARLFTGTVQNESPLSAEGFCQGGTSLEVLVYPKYGQRFHREDCTIVKQQTEDGNPGWNMDREEAERKGYTPCIICGGGMS